MPQRTRQQGQEETVALTHPASTRAFALALCGVALVCLGAAYAVFENQKRAIEANARSGLADIAILKAGQLEHWRRERLSDAMAFSEHTALAKEFDRWLATGMPDGPGCRWMRQHLETIWRSHADDYRGVLLLDRQGRDRLATADADAADAGEKALALQAIAGRQVVAGDIHLDAARRPAMDVAAPLLVDEGESARVAGAMVFRIDPASYVYPMVESWPVESRSAETLLVRGAGDDVLFLNRLRHANAARLSLRLPIASPDMPAAQALRGKNGFTSGRDYRGEPVVAYVLAVPDTDWFLVAKMDEAELYAPIRTLACYVVLGLLGMLGFAAYVFWTMRSRAELAYLGYRSELRNRVLAQRFDNIARSASDIIVLTDEKGRIVEANDRAVEAFGYPYAEMLRLTVSDLRAPACRDSIERDQSRLKTYGSGVYETIYLRRDGTLFSADVSGHVIRDGERIFMQAIIRDITERKRTEAALRLHEQMTRTMQEGLALVRDEDGIIVFANPRLEAMFGYAAGELCGRHVGCLHAVAAGSPAGTAARIMAALKEFGAWSGEVCNARKDGSTFWCKATVSGLDHPDQGRVWLTIQTDITALKSLEVARQVHLNRIRELGRHLVAVQETERRKLGAELHDRTSANLAAAKLLLRDLASLLPERPGEMLAHKLEDLDALIADTNQTVRDISVNLRPPLLDFLGLCATLKSLAGKFAHRTGVTVEVHCRNVPRLDGEVETTLYRIVEEALTNCGKHAGATRVDVLLTSAAGRLQLTVADDGAGFDADAAKGRGSLGLLTMRERIELADGTLVIESMPGRGTTLRVDVPCITAFPPLAVLPAWSAGSA